MDPDWGGGGGGGVWVVRTTSFWWTPKLHKEGKNHLVLVLDNYPDPPFRIPVSAPGDDIQLLFPIQRKKLVRDEIFTISQKSTHFSLNIDLRILKPHIPEHPFPLGGHTDYSILKPMKRIGNT